MFRYDVFIGSLLGIIATSLACHPQKTAAPRDLSTVFPDAARALGPFSISLEKSRATDVLSEARIKLQERADHQLVTLQLKMIHSQEQVTLSFLHQSQPVKRIKTSQGAEGDQGVEILSQGNRIHERMVGSGTVQSVQEDSVNDPDGSMSEGTSGASRCMPSTAFVTDSAALQQGHRTPSLHDAAALFHLPLPRSIHEASDLEVKGAGATWSVVDGALVWPAMSKQSDRIDLSWTRAKVAELRFPLLTQEPPQNLKARRIDQDGVQDITVSWRDGYVWIAEQYHQPGSWLELQYEVPARSSEFLLPQMPVFAGMKTLVLQPNCTHEFMLEKNHLSWSCSPQDGPLWAASYQFHQRIGAMDFQDWPELAAHAPDVVSALWDAGEKLEVATYGHTHVLPQIPEEAARICMRATWRSDRTY